MAEYVYDRIFAPDDAVRSIAEQNGTPFYLYDQKGIEDSVRSLHSAFSWVSGYQNYFVIRQNPNPRILQILAKSGTGVSACSYTELLLAKSCGFSGEQLIYEPGRKDDRAEALAKQLGATWMINSTDLLPEDLPQRIILHYHPMEEKLTSVQLHRIGKSKNGIQSPWIFDVIADLHQRGVKSIGVALQVASYSITPGFWAKKAEILLDLAKETKKRLGFSLWCLHLGEGPGLPYQPRVTAPTIAEEADNIRLLSNNEEIPVIFTGVNSQLMEHSGLLVTKILEQRDIYYSFLVLDAGFCQYIRPVLKSAYRHISVLGKNQIENRKKYYLVGELPDEIDRPAQKGRMLPKVTAGEYCIVHDVGCGSRSMPLLYGFAPVTAEYLYTDSGSIQQISPRRTEEEVLDFLTTL